LRNEIFFAGAKQDGPGSGSSKVNCRKNWGSGLVKSMARGKVYYASAMRMLLLALLLASCSGEDNCCPSATDIATGHKEKLRAHFRGNGRTTDISTLIAETRRISARLKRENRYAEARKFDSYTDVLMFGNNTLEESLNDVMELIGYENTTSAVGNTAVESGKKHCPSLLESLYELLQI
jgi:hypothetical protein